MARGGRNRRGGRGRRDNRPRTLYSRVTVVVLNLNRVLLVKHNRENTWALPGGRLMAGEEPERRAILEVAEETGLQISAPQFAGRYAGSVASHQIYVAQASGEPRPNRRELQDATWWNGGTTLDVQTHVNAILAIVRSSGIVQERMEASDALPPDTR